MLFVLLCTPLHVIEICSVASFSREAAAINNSKLQTKSAAAPSNNDIKGANYHEEEPDKIYPVSCKVVSDVRKQLKANNGYCETGSDDDSEESDADMEDSRPYYGSTILQLDLIECKIGNKKYRFNKAQGFVEV